MAVVEARQPAHDGNGHRHDQRPKRRAEVSGLTTIDADEPVGESLLVDAEEMGASQPRRRRRGPPPADVADGNPPVKTPVEAPSE